MARTKKTRMGKKIGSKERTERKKKKYQDQGPPKKATIPTALKSQSTTFVKIVYEDNEEARRHNSKTIQMQDDSEARQIRGKATQGQNELTARRRDSKTT